MRRVEHNFAHGVRDVRLFEIGTVFRKPEGGLAAEERRIAAAFSGARAPAHWSGAAGTFDVYDLKALLEELAAEYADGRVVAGEVDGVPGLHLLAGDAVVGRGWQAAEGAVDAPAWAGARAAAGGRRSRRRPAGARRARSRSPPSPGSERDLALLVPTR